MYLKNMKIHSNTFLSCLWSFSCPCIWGSWFLPPLISRTVYPLPDSARTKSKQNWEETQFMSNSQRCQNMCGRFFSHGSWNSQSEFMHFSSHCSRASGYNYIRPSLGNQKGPLNAAKSPHLMGGAAICQDCDVPPSPQKRGQREGWVWLIGSYKPVCSRSLEFPHMKTCAHKQIRRMREIQPRIFTLLLYKFKMLNTINEFKPYGLRVEHNNLPSNIDMLFLFIQTITMHMLHCLFWLHTSAHQSYTEPEDNFLFSALFEITSNNFVFGNTVQQPCPTSMD